MKLRFKIGLNSALRVRVNKGQRVGAPPRNFFFRGSNLPPLGGPPSQIESARHRYFWPKWAPKVTHRINKAFQKPIFWTSNPHKSIFLVMTFSPSWAQKMSLEPYFELAKFFLPAEQFWRKSVQICVFRFFDSAAAPRTETRTFRHINGKVSA